MGEIAVFAVDVGSMANIGWWRQTASDDSSSGRDLDTLAEAVANDLLAGTQVALGFEAPLFIPRPTSTVGLNRQRVGDRGRPWCAGAGTGALAVGVQQSAYVFAAVSQRVRPCVTFDFGALLRHEADLLVWEAFVSGAAKDRTATDPHVDDARRAAYEFRTRLDAGHVTSDVQDPLVLNLVAAGLLACGLSSDLSLLTTPCLVVKPPALGLSGVR